MIPDRVRAFLDRNGVKYATVHHSTAYTAQEIAASAHVPGKEMAKTVMVRIDDRMAMVVLPAAKRIAIERLQAITGAPAIRLAHEYEFERYFPDCEAGAMPPFGNLYGFEVFVDPDLTADEMIAFNAGSHTELIRMAYADFQRLVEPRVLAPA